ncbi:MAG: hypothetical protein LBQ00_05170 [Syntrophobacterales bacterium]|jgi:hypothetical protein|nr:hypothetical protein [Syntrophobacterales bacterium]
MLNELFELSVALRHYGLLQSTTNPNVNSVGKTDCLLIELDKEGTPRGVRLLQKKDTSALWKHGKGNHNNFPAIRVQKPILARTESEKIENADWSKLKLSEKIDHLQALDFNAISPERSYIKISDWSLNELADVGNSENQELLALRQLLSVFPKEAGRAGFNKKLVDFLLEKLKLSISSEEADFFKKMLVGALNKKTRKYEAKCMTYYDVYETDCFNNVVGSSATRQALIDLLDSVVVGGAPLVDKVVSPLSGEIDAAAGKKYPNPNIPLLGLTYLYSKNSAIPCLTRYKLSGVEAYKAGKNDVMAIHNAITFLTDGSRENKSWKKMSDSNRDKSNLLLAYLADDPQNNACLAQILSDYESDEEKQEESESIFDALCHQVLDDNIEAVISKNPLSKINLVILETLDPGRKQVVYENTFTSEQFRNNLGLWSAAAKNHPNIEIRVRDKKNILIYKPLCPGPNDICKLLKINYTRSGQSKSMQQSIISLSDIYRLYMPSKQYALHDEDFLADVMRKVVEKTAQMLGDVGNKLILEYALSSNEKTRAKDAALTVSLISILLWRLYVRKEKYMLEAPFNVGQFMQLADMLHKEYCIHVRNGGDKNKPLPAQLMGNEMLVIASENPVEGLNRLRDRMKIYLAWANTSGEGVGLAKWILSRYGEVSTKIAACDLPEQFNATEQAQVLLGYLASIPVDTI